MYMYIFIYLSNSYLHIFDRAKSQYDSNMQVWVELAKCVLNFFFFCCGAQFTAIYVYTMTVSGAQNNKENAHT